MYTPLVSGTKWSERGGDRESDGGVRVSEEQEGQRGDIDVNRADREERREALWAEGAIG